MCTRGTRFQGAQLKGEQFAPFGCRTQHEQRNQKPPGSTPIQSMRALLQTAQADPPTVAVCGHALLMLGSSPTWMKP